MQTSNEFYRKIHDFAGVTILEVIIRGPRPTREIFDDGTDGFETLELRVNAILDRSISNELDRHAK